MTYTLRMGPAFGGTAPVFQRFEDGAPTGTDLLDEGGTVAECGRGCFTVTTVRTSSIAGFTAVRAASPSPSPTTASPSPAADEGSSNWALLGLVGLAAAVPVSCAVLWVRRVSRAPSKPHTESLYDLLGSPTAAPLSPLSPGFAQPVPSPSATPASSTPGDGRLRPADLGSPTHRLLSPTSPLAPRPMSAAARPSRGPTPQAVQQPDLRSASVPAFCDRAGPGAPAFVVARPATIPPANVLPPAKTGGRLSPENAAATPAPRPVSPRAGAVAASALSRSPAPARVERLVVKQPQPRGPSPGACPSNAGPRPPSAVPSEK